MSKAKIVLWGSVSFIFGIFLDSLFKETLLYLAGSFFILGIILISVWRGYKKALIIGFCFLALAGGVARHYSFQSRALREKTDNDFISSLNDKGEVVFEGKIIFEPEITPKNIRYIIGVRKIRTGDAWQEARGRVLVFGDLYSRYQYGDELRIRGKIKTPENFNGFDYPGYLAKDGIYSLSHYPQMELVDSSKGNFLYSRILRVKGRIEESLAKNFSPPQSEILSAVLLGDKRNLGEELKEKLDTTGVRHITAISGMHITILINLLMVFGIALGLWRGQAFYFALLSIIFFIIAIGLPASAVRAAIMGGLFLLAQKTGRYSKGLYCLVFAAAFMLYLNPLLLESDVGFELSFAATSGIILFSEKLKTWFKKLPPVFQLREILAMTLSAQITTLPLVWYYFGRVSLVAPIVNLLVIPSISFIMISGFAAIVAGMFWDFLGKIFSWPAWFGLTYLIKIIDWFS